MGTNSCTLLPHGGYALIPTVLTTCAWLSSIFQDGCDYAIVNGPIVQTMTGDENLPWLEVGFAAFRKPRFDDESQTWAVTYSGSCVDYNPDRLEFDPAWKAAKGFAFLALVLGGGGALFLWFSACCVFSKATWRWAGYEVLLAGTFQTMAFMWYGNDLCQHRNSCTFGWGSKADVVASVFWCLAALSIFCKYPIPRSKQKDLETTQPELIITDSTETDLNSPGAFLPIDGDATATLPSTPVESAFKDGRDLKDVEVL